MSHYHWHRGLVLTDQTVGMVALIARLGERYCEGHYKLLPLPAQPFQAALSNAMKHQEVVKLRDRLADDNRFLHQELYRLAGDNIVGIDFGLKDMMELVDRVAYTNSPVLLYAPCRAHKIE